jgi:type IV pilus assembly protein PilA
MQRNEGFTIIELMAVVSIVSILAVLALSAYNDYTIRAKVSEGMHFAAEAKTSVSEYFYNIGRMPVNNGQAGLADADTYDQYGFIERLEIKTTPTEGSIAITFKLPGTNADGKELWMVPRLEERLIYWDCYAPDDNGIDTNQAPPNCRG